MKILVLAYKFPLDSSGAIVSGEVKNPFNFCVELARLGHDVTAFSIDAISEKVEKEVCGVKVFSFPDLKIKGVLRYLYRAYVTGKWIKANAEKYELIHSHASFNGLGVIFSGFHKSKPFISTPHGTNVPEISTELSFNLKDALRRVNSFLQMKLDSFVYKKSRLCVSVSEFQVKEMCGIYQIPIENIHIVYNGVPPIYDNSFSDVYKYDFLFVGRAAKKKGLDIVVNLAMHFKLEKFKVVLGTARFKTVSDDLIEKLNLLDNVDVEWAVDEFRMPSIYASSKILIVPSRGYESLPTVILEAIRSKIWVVATNAWGNPEVILDERLLFEEDNMDSILTSIDYVKSLSKDDYKLKYIPKLVEEEVGKLNNLIEGCVK